MRAFFIGVMTLLALMLGGCAPPQEIGELAVVMGVAVGQREGQLLVTAELAHRDSIDGEDQSLTMTVSAPDWPTVEEELAAACDKRLYWGHLVLLLLDDSWSGEDVPALLEHFYLDQRLAPTIYVALCRGEGGAMLEAGFGEAAYASQGLAQHLSVWQSEDEAMSLTVERCMQRQYHGQEPLMALLELEQGKTSVAGTLYADEL